MLRAIQHVVAPLAGARIIHRPWYGEVQGSTGRFQYVTLRISNKYVGGPCDQYISTKTICASNEADAGVSSSAKRKICRRTGVPPLAPEDKARRSLLLDVM